MNLVTKISEDLKIAMKEKNLTRLSILRVLKSEIQRSEQTSNGKIEISDADVIKLVKKLIQGIKETTNNMDELFTLNAYLPKQLSEDEIREKLSLLSIKDMGAIMKFFKANYEGQYDGKNLSNILKSTYE